MLGDSPLKVLYQKCNHYSPPIPLPPLPAMRKAAHPCFLLRTEHLVKVVMQREDLTIIMKAPPSCCDKIHGVSHMVLSPPSPPSGGARQPHHPSPLEGGRELKCTREIEIRLLLFHQNTCIFLSLLTAS